MLARYSILLAFLSTCLTFAEPARALEVIDSFPAPASESRGLAWDGEYLWCADPGTDSVYKLDPTGGAVVSSFPFSIESDYGGITWSADTTLWIANGSRISEVNPANGNFISTFSCPGG